MSSRWQANKIGLVNFWYYDDEQEFTFADGRMLLRGSNGSGKSVTMQSVVPLLLDGNMSPERLDPFGGRDRKMSSYLLEDDDEREERTGYLYMEFKRKESDDYLTIGMGICAKKGKQLDKWYFSISDGRRIGKDFLLYKATDEKITLSKRELENRIEDGGRVFDKQSEYMDYVNSHIFGFETREEYKELIDLLIQLRTPKLSKDFKPSVINEILSDSLQPLSEEDLRPMSEAIENMDLLSRKLKDEETAVAAAEKIGRAYDKYNKFELFRKASAYKQKQDELVKLRSSQKEKKAEVKRCEDTLVELEKQYVEMEAKKNALQKELESLQDSDASSLKKREIELEKEEDNFAKTAREKEGVIEKKEEQRRDNEEKIRAEEDERYTHEKKLNDFLEEMGDDAEAMAFDEHAFFRDELLRQIDKAFDYSVHKKQFADTKDKIEKTARVLQEAENLKKQEDEAYERRDRMARRLDAEQRKRAEADNTLTRTIDEWKESLYNWAENNVELKLDSAQLSQISRFGENYDADSDYNMIRQFVFDCMQEYRNDLKSGISDKEEGIKENKEKTVAVELELDEWENFREPEPERSDAVKTNRERLKEKGIPYNEFYKVMEFSDDLSETECNRLEEALEKMGILDALVIEERYRDEVLAFTEGCEDRYLFAGKSESGQSLLDVLQLNDEINDIFSNQRLAGILAGISYEADGQLAVYSDGSYRMGMIAGTISGQHEAEFIGTKARENARLLRIKACKEELANLRDELEKLEMEKEELEKRVDQIEDEYKSLPNDSEIKDVWKNLQIIEENCDRLEAEKKGIEGELNIIKDQIRQKKEEAYECGRQLHLDLVFSVFNEAVGAAVSYDKLLVRLESEHEIYVKTVGNIQSLRVQAETIEADLSLARDELEDAKRNQNRKTIELESVREQLKLTNYEEIKERLDECHTWLGGYDTISRENATNKTRNEEIRNRLVDEIEEGSKKENILVHSEERLSRCFAKELNLGYVQLPEEVKQDAKNVIAYLKSDVDGLDKDTIDQKLLNVYFSERNMLVGYNLSKTEELFAEEDFDKASDDISAKRKDIKARFNGQDIPFLQMLNYLKDDVDELKALIKEKDRDLFEDILTNTISRKIRNKINAADTWVRDMNRLMENMNTSSGLKLSLRWRSKAAETEDQLDTRELVQLLKKDYRSMTEEEGSKLSLHFRSKVDEARRNSGDNAGLISFYQVMKDTLDYRKWFEFQLFAQKTGERQKELTNSVFGTFSGGEKAMAMYVPLFSAVVAKYKGGGDMAPRLISLDEAFAGVDSRNIRDMFRLMSEFDFDFIINSQVLWGDYDTLSSLAIYQLQRPGNAKFVTVMSYLWNGKARELLDDAMVIEQRSRQINANRAN